MSFSLLSPPHLPDLLRALQKDPVPNVFLLHLARRTGLSPDRGGTAFYAHRDSSGEIVGVGAFGATLLAWSPLQETLSLIVGEALRRKGEWRTLLGDARYIDPLWDSLRPHVPPPVEDHLEDWMALARSEFRPAPSSLQVRIAGEADLPRILPLRFAMQTELEPRTLSAPDRERVRRRCRESIRDGHLFYMEEGKEVVFTAAFSAATPEVTQVSSVFTRADRRGRGIATGALSTLCAHALKTSERVSLFVLPSNAPATRLYRRLGFRPHASARSIRLR
jgi:predicted GNAT family acetyltransferase